LHDRGDNSVANCDIGAFSARFSQRKDARRATAEVNEGLIAAHGGDDALNDLARAERPEFAFVEELFHRLGFALGVPYPLIDRHTRSGRAHNVPSV
jgi:hypothetical protein